MGAKLGWATTTSCSSSSKHRATDCVQDKGATTRLDAYPCTIKTDSFARQIYGAIQISERPRHREEVNNVARATIEHHAQKGRQVGGTTEAHVN
jgi:CTP synthase